ncbi:porin [Mariniflexile litorale]|uniref:Porin n=1 Tax=Mariniflexile litorale TaxID=3045158 RepID=A0AAU7EK41_9FLAO|nr:porin [Mariniflexile sp. KMM 9835]MDQ8211207.1 porin [Mariniflexile sp. KMM 9835]
MKIKFSIVAILIYATTSLNAQEINGSKFGKGLLNIVGQDSSWTMKVGLRMQFLSLASWDAEDGRLMNPNSDFSVRRARLKFEGFAYSPKLEYKLELGLSNDDLSGGSVYTGNAPRHILDAVVKWNFYKDFVLWAGQTKLPGNRERVISSGNMQFVDRSLLNSRFTIDRDMGIQLHHHFNLSKTFVVKEIVAISQGEGRNITKGNLGGHQYTTRLELFPFGEFTDGGDYSGSDLKREKTPKLALAVTYDFNNNAVKTRSNQGAYMVIDNEESFFETNINTLYIDAMFKYLGFSFMGEYAQRDAKDPYAKNSDGSLTGAEVQVGNGLNMQAGYLFKSNWEISGRYTNIELNKTVTGKDAENQYTLGVSKYIVGHKLKVQSDISYLDIANSNNQLLYRLQFDIHF